MEEKWGGQVGEGRCRREGRHEAVFRKCESFLVAGIQAAERHSGNPLHINEFHPESVFVSPVCS